MNVPRDVFYEKEAEVVVSRSYGPGRYDRNYEERGGSTTRSTSGGRRRGTWRRSSNWCGRRRSTSTA
ncbi:hypothetical protein [Methanoculleus chikugoensis]|uniref:hypothetical protein n=1 Tax=Methanoculleus chikugoensis TaxID=118126 RepID=UPI001FB28903|nr:hypothetical protein [Methanoculleus chikugoensis]